MDVSYWLIFLSAAVAISLSPGPDLFYIVSRTITQGRMAGVCASLGVCSGALVHVLAAALGLSVILATSAYAFTFIKWVGAVYLVYLGLRALFTRAPGGSEQPNRQSNKVSLWQAYRQGVLIDVLNPKVAIFFMAFLPQFVRSDWLPVTEQLLLLGCLVVVIGAAVELMIVWGLGYFGQLTQRAHRLSLYLERLMGGVLIALGVRLALSERP